MDITKHNGTLYFTYFIIILFAYLCLHTYYYLVQLSKCECFLRNKIYSTNIEFLKFYQILELISLFILFSILMFLKPGKKTQGMNIKSSKYFLQFIQLTTVMLLLFLSGYLSLNVYRFYNGVTQDCKCVNKWQKYFLYYQGIVNTITFFRLLISILVILFLFLFFK